ncbi:right-handed parallel beta-helix repeat-containing protein [Klenkia sp. PcliD-1-E]|uniref:right-handed parallel beta-helix repeat-containing protein n=1 Tax=Klenkia sp. PcliD-1-E TaxID=2954492 RepID=UPI002098148D|nr:right-handed parallel beta-helix repeat-containing protein [Klenkia sp. PcliD-1-E]MCO7218803.1 AAA family ATPase [Klenkia sp. PcliD-1-E]
MSGTLQVDADRPGAYPTLAEALLDAPSGATVVVAAGSYDEVLDVRARDLVITAAPDAEVRVGGSAHEPTLRVRGGAVTVRGLVLVGRQAHVVDAEEARLVLADCVLEAGHGAGVRVTDRSTLEMTDCTVTGAQQGLVVEDSGGTLERVTVADSADDAVVVRLGADPVLRDCVVRGSGARGVYAYASARPVLEGCEVETSGGPGVAVAQGASATLRRCSVRGTGGPDVEFGAGTSGRVEACRTERTGDAGVSVAAGADVAVTEAPAAASVGVGSSPSAKGDPERVEQLLAELDAMVGLAGVKAEVRSIIDEIQVNEWRRAAGLAVGGASHHLVFAGAPGTGKTTVGRIYGQLLAALGVLPGGPLKEVSRRDLVGQYIGHTAEKTAAVFDEAAGGVVFLDEAYTLTRQAGGGGNDFGQEAVDMIVKLMEDRRDSLAVIAAGYTDEMVQFLDANPGLASRFVKTVEFENYGPEELTRIITSMITSGDYLLGPQAGAMLRLHFETVPRGADFGNAREARKLFEKLRKVQSQRLRLVGRQPTLEELQTLTVDDVRVAVAD